MTPRETVKPATLSPEQQEMANAVARATRDAALTHARLGHPVATYRDGKVVWLQPAEVFALLGEVATPAQDARPA